MKPERPGKATRPLRTRRRMPAWAWIAIGTGLAFLPLVIWRFGSTDPRRLQDRAEAAARAGDWNTALELWRQVNRTAAATAATHLAQGRACLAQGLANQAEQALQSATAADPADPQPWLLRLEILRVEDRLTEVFALGWQALEHVEPGGRQEVLRELTLAALTDLPDDLARGTLRRWVEADPADLDARVAYLRRMGAEPRGDDPDRETRLANLAQILSSHPDHLGAREGIVSALADAGEPDRGRSLLDGWSDEHRDSRYWRLRGRWDLDLDGRPEQAVAALRKTLVDFPHDWRTHYRLARALTILRRPDEARREAETVQRIREILDPITLGPRLESALAHVEEPSARETLANLCARAGLSRLADAWRAVPPDSLDRRSPAPDEDFGLGHVRTTRRTRPP